MGGAVSKSFAVESGTFTNNLSGASVGLPLGAAPPPGLYTGFETLWGAPGGQGGVNYGNQGGTGAGGGPGGTAIKSAFIGVVPVVWATGWNFFGGSVVLDAIQAFYTVGVAGPGLNGLNVGNGPLAGQGFAGPAFAGLIVPVVANTTWGFSISWNLGQGWFFAAGFAFEGPDGSQYAGVPNPDYWSFEPTWAVSYLANNWVLSANMAYFFSTASAGTGSNWGGTAVGNGYTNGNEFYLDMTALYKFGKWEIGPVASWVTQTTNDTPGSGITCAAIAGSGIGCGLEQRVRVGGLIGYDFGPVDLQVWVTDDVYCVDAAGCGVNVWSRLGFRLWAPEAPKPLVAKN